jgi:hypothetical protein
MKVGDLVRVMDCELMLGELDIKCSCFFCAGNSNRIGIILSPAPQRSWNVMFDCGEWRLDMFDFARGDVKIINEITV